MGNYTVRIDGADYTFEAETLEAARAEAASWLSYGEWNDSPETVWVKGHLLWTDDDGDECQERVRVTIDPEAPDCVNDDKHDWQSPHELVGGLKENPGVWGKDGGVIIVEACLRCGCKRERNTWAQDRETGERGLESVRYERDAFRR